MSRNGWLAAVPRLSDKNAAHDRLLRKGQHRMDPHDTLGLRGHLSAIRPRLVDRLTPAQKSRHNNFLVSVRTLKTGLDRSVDFLDRIRAHRIQRLLGYRTLAEYAAAHAGFTSSQTRDFLYIAGRLQDYPLVARALVDGELSWGKAREICSKVEPEHQELWVDPARSLPRNQLREAIAATRKTMQPELEGEQGIAATDLVRGVSDAAVTDAAANPGTDPGVQRTPPATSRHAEGAVSLRGRWLSADAGSGDPSPPAGGPGGAERAGEHGGPLLALPSGAA